MALKPVKQIPTVELRPKLNIHQSALDYAKAYAQETGRSLEEVLNQALNQVLRPGKGTKKGDQ